MTKTKNKNTKTSNIENDLKAIPNVALKYEIMIDAEKDLTSSLTEFVQEFNGDNLEIFDTKNISLHLWENWKFRTKNGIKQGENATDKPKTIATQMSCIRTYLKSGEKITKNTTFADIQNFQTGLKENNASPEQQLKKEISKNLKSFSEKDLKMVLEFISKI